MNKNTHSIFAPTANLITFEDKKTEEDLMQTT